MIDPKNITPIKEGASYLIPKYKVTNDGLEDVDGGFTLNFVKGNKADESVPRQEGFMTETLLEVCLQYLQFVNVGDLANRNTSLAITHIEDALFRLGKRASEREKRDVIGTYQK